MMHGIAVWSSNVSDSLIFVPSSAWFKRSLDTSDRLYVVLSITIVCCSVFGDHKLLSPRGNSYLSRLLFYKDGRPSPWLHRGSWLYYDTEWSVKYLTDLLLSMAVLHFLLVLCTISSISTQWFSRYVVCLLYYDTTLHRQIVVAYY